MHFGSVWNPVLARFGVSSRTRLSPKRFQNALIEIRAKILYLILIGKELNKLKVKNLITKLLQYLYYLRAEKNFIKDY